MTWRILPVFCGLTLAATLTGGCSSDATKNDDACMPDDADGIADEAQTLTLNVDDTEFSPKILTTQNTSKITLTFNNNGSTPHSFVVDCLPTPNDDGCPAKSCFADEAKVDPVAPGESARIVFESPVVEGVYTFHSDVAGDEATGQFIIQ